MSTSDPPPLRDLLKQARQRFLAEYEPHRPALYRYCRHLTHRAWDAEDLVQETLARAMVTLATQFEPVKNPRGWLFRIASNAWIDHVRRARELAVTVAEQASSEPPPQALREAAGTLIEQLSPQERAAVVLKDVFDLSLEEIAEILATSPGAIKAALHRGRSRLAEPKAENTRTPAPGVIDAFCAAFNRRDLAALTALLLDTATIELVGAFLETRERRLLEHTLFEPLASGVPAQHLGDHDPTQPVRAEQRAYRGEPIVLYWYAHASGPKVRSIVRLEFDDVRIARMREYFFTPDVLVDICDELGVPCHINGYA